MEKEHSKLFRVFERLDECQQRIIKMTNKKSILLAGPGTGKTTLIAHKIAYLLLSDVKPSEILLFTFTNKSAKQIISSVEKITGINLRENKILAGTFYTICNTWLRTYANEIDISPNYTIFDRHDAKKYMKLLSLNKNIDAFYTDYYIAPESILYSLY
ncbi:UvrD-helicase domain-containing protein [Fervidobacterium sp.]